MLCDKFDGNLSTFESYSPKKLLAYFLPRDAMRKRGLCCRPVSVRPSVRHVGVLYPEG